MINVVFIGVGSNVDPRRNISQALDAMLAAFGNLEQSPVYQSAAVGFTGDDFLNLVVKFETSLDIASVVRQLRAIEDSQGRDRTQPRFSKRPIDLDILLYNDLEMDEPGIQVPRGEILESSFVLKPLSDLAPDLRHPVAQRSYRELWQLMAPEAAHLELVSLDEQQQT